MHSSQCQAEIHPVAHARGDRVGTEPSCFDAHHAHLPGNGLRQNSLASLAAVMLATTVFNLYEDILVLLRSLQTKEPGRMRSSPFRVQIPLVGKRMQVSVEGRWIEARRTAARDAEDLFDELHFSQRSERVGQKDLGSASTRSEAYSEERPGRIYCLKGRDFWLVHCKKGIHGSKFCHVRGYNYDLLKI